MVTRSFLPVLLGFLTLVACGGSVEPTPTPGTNTPPVGNGGKGGGGGGGAGGAGGAAGGGEAQCTMMPSCKPGFTEVKGCIPDAECTTATACGATIICMRDEAQCDGIPNCDPGDTEVPNQAACPQDVSCYKRETCGITIWCSGK